MGAAALHTLIETELDSAASIAKAAPTAASDQPRRKDGKALGSIRQMWPSRVYVNLGIDASGGMRRKKMGVNSLGTRMANRKQERS